MTRRDLVYTYLALAKPFSFDSPLHLFFNHIIHVLIHIVRVIMVPLSVLTNTAIVYISNRPLTEAIIDQLVKD